MRLCVINLNHHETRAEAQSAQRLQRCHDAKKTRSDSAATPASLRFPGLKARNISAQGKASPRATPWVQVPKGLKPCRGDRTLVKLHTCGFLKVKLTLPPLCALCVSAG